MTFDLMRMNNIHPFRFFANRIHDANLRTAHSLKAKILNVVDVSSTKRLSWSAEILTNVKFIQEKKLIGKYFEELKNSTSGEIVVKHFGKDQESDQSNFHDAETNAELEVQDEMPLLEWFANEYKRFGCTLEFMTNKSREGSQFCRGFGGFGGMLRYQLDMRTFDELSDNEVYEDSD
ncbi:hypothetical protein Bca4012_008972 [Brassica carinata]